MIDKEKLKEKIKNLKHANRANLGGSNHPLFLHGQRSGWNYISDMIDSGELDVDMEAAWGCKGCFFNSERSTSLCHNWQKDDICVKCANFERSETDAKP